MRKVEDILTEAEIQLTAIRILIYKEILNYDGVFTLADIEQRILSIDKSTIFRTLNLFLKKNLLHEVDDGSGSKKYCLCQCGSKNHNSHIHFTCLSCRKTYCIKDIAVQHVDLPISFQVTDVNYVLKGICPDCNKDSDKRVK